MTVHEGGWVYKSSFKVRDVTMLNGAFRIHNMFRSMNGASTQTNFCP